MDIGCGNPADAQRRHGIIWIVAGHHIEHDCGVGNGSRQRPGGVLRKRDGDDTGAADQPPRGTNAEQAIGEDGERMEFTVSEPVPTVAKLAAKAAPVPPEEPPGVRDSS